MLSTHLESAAVSWSWTWAAYDLSPSLHFQVIQTFMCFGQQRSEGRKWQSLWIKDYELPKLAAPLDHFKLPPCSCETELTQESCISPFLPFMAGVALICHWKLLRWAKHSSCLVFSFPGRCTWSYTSLSANPGGQERCHRVWWAAWVQPHSPGGSPAESRWQDKGDLAPNLNTRESGVSGWAEQ